MIVIRHGEVPWVLGVPVYAQEHEPSNHLRRGEHDIFRYVAIRRELRTAGKPSALDVFVKNEIGFVLWRWRGGGRGKRGWGPLS